MLAAEAFAAAPGRPGREAFAKAVCNAAEARATENGLDPHFLVRLLWKESMFDPNAVSPKGAQGLAQFMPGTAELRGLADPFDPLAAVAASASYLADLKKEFGNIGLAAAAYNAGEERVRRWRAGQGGMPAETQDYVAFITGREVEAWKDANASHPVPSAGSGTDVVEDCVKLAMRLQAPSGAAVRLGKRRPWGVLVAQNFSQGQALAMYRRLKVRAPQILSQVEPMVIRKRNLSRGSRAMSLVMVGADSRDAANAICARLTGTGVPCRVMKSR
ncbi:MAG: lytic transglycosylase domain-containing protein [Rhizobiales bacterium]|nr:lytic transglycosylase domain-containing protein [Hyphomicrobiales bacterium]